MHQPYMMQQPQHGMLQHHAMIPQHSMAPHAIQAQSIATQALQAQAYNQVNHMHPGRAQNLAPYMQNPLPYAQPSQHIQSAAPSQSWMQMSGSQAPYAGVTQTPSLQTMQRAHAGQYVFFFFLEANYRIYK